MTLNAVGSYGFLARAHLDHALVGDLTVAAHAADVAARTQVQAAIVNDLDRRLGQVDGAVDEATRRGKTMTAMTLMADQRRQRGDLLTTRIREARTLADLQIETATVEGERGKVAADAGPIRYFSSLIGCSDEAVMRWFVLLVAVLLDPLAVALLLAATVTGRAP